MISELRELIGRVEPIIEEEEVPSWRSTGRVLSRDVYAPMDVPPRRKSIYDGYAVRGLDTQGAPIKLRLVGSVNVGEMPRFEVRPGECAYVGTGAYLPDGADAVVPKEYSEVFGDYVVVNRVVKPGENIDEVGSYVKRGELLMRRGYVITAIDAAALPLLGVGSVHVYRRLRVYLIITGNELVVPREPEDVVRAMLEGKVVESTGRLIEEYIASRMPYAEVVGKVIIPDDPAELREHIARGLALADMIITTGGTGPGGLDYAYEATESLGPLTYLKGLRMRPGRPTGVALFKGKVVINLSGHPISSLNGLISVVEPIARRMSNVSRGLPEPRIVAKLGMDELGGEDLMRQYRVRVTRTGDGYSVEVLLKHGSSHVETLIMADGLVNLEPGRRLRKGDPVEVFLIREIT